MTDRGYSVGGKYRPREVTPSSHPYKPEKEVHPLSPDNISEYAKLYANRVAMLYGLYSLKAFQYPWRCAEIGVYEGIFSQSILDVMHPKELHLFDINTAPIMQSVRSRGEVTVKEGDSSTNLAVYPDESFDFIYIDGDHSYEGVQKDADVAKLKVRPGGILAFNDYTIWSYYEMAEYGVPYVVNNLCVLEGFKVIAFAFMHHGYHDIALVKP